MGRKYLLEIYSGTSNACAYIKNYHSPRAHQDFILHTTNDSSKQNVIGSRNMLENASELRSIIDLSSVGFNPKS